MKRLCWLLAFVPMLSFGAVVTISWVNPTQYTDGSTLPVSDIGSTTVQYATCNGGSLGNVLGTFSAQGAATSAASPNLAAGTYCFEASTNSLAHGTSVPSAAITFTVPAAPPTFGTTGTNVFLATQIPDGWAFTHVGTVAVGSPCDSTQSVNGYNVVIQKGLTVTWDTAIHPLAIMAPCH